MINIFTSNFILYFLTASLLLLKLFKLISTFAYAPYTPVSRHLIATRKSDFVSILNIGAKVLIEGQILFAVDTTLKGTSMHLNRALLIISSFLIIFSNIFLKNYFFL